MTRNTQQVALGGQRPERKVAREDLKSQRKGDKGEVAGKDL